MWERTKGWDTTKGGRRSMSALPPYGAATVRALSLSRNVVTIVVSQCRILPRSDVPRKNSRPHFVNCESHIDYENKGINRRITDENCTAFSIIAASWKVDHGASLSSIDRLQHRIKIISRIIWLWNIFDISREDKSVSPPLAFEGWRYNSVVTIEESVIFFNELRIAVHEKEKAREKDRARKRESAQRYVRMSASIKTTKDID